MYKGKKHTLELKDFQDFVSKALIAACSADSKRLILETYVWNSVVRYVLYVQVSIKSVTFTLSDAIESYNEV